MLLCRVLCQKELNNVYAPVLAHIMRAIEALPIMVTKACAIPATVAVYCFCIHTMH